MAATSPQAQTNPQAQQAANTNAAPSFDASFFAQNNRIHIEDGSQFLPMNYLMIAPQELAPENQQRTFAKIVKHLSIPAPSFFQSPSRAMVMEAMASFLPISKEAHLSSLKEETEKLEIFAQTGLHPDVEAGLSRYQRPFVANAQLREEKPAIDAVTQEYLDNAALLYLVLNEALTQQGRPNEPASYVRHFGSADSVLGDLADKIGLSIAETVEVLQTQGVDGFAAKLNVAPELVQEMRDVVKLSADHFYADNIIASWDAGRHMQGMQNRSIDEKVALGVLQRAGGLMQYLQQTIPVDAPKPEDVMKNEALITAILREMPKELQEALYYSGLEMGFVNGGTLGGVMPMLGHAAGVNMHVPFEFGGDNGVRLIINSNLENLQKTRTILHHEANHLFFSKQMGEEGIAQFDALISQGAKRLGALKNALDEWKTAPTDDAKRDIERQINDQFKVGEIGLTEALERNSDNALGMDTLHGWVDHAVHNLDPDSPALSRGYPIPELRAAEIISRFAEMLFVKLEDHPALLGFIAPELMAGYHDIYLPHLAQQVEQIKTEQSQLPEPLRFMGLPPEAIIPQPKQSSLNSEFNMDNVVSIAAKSAPEAYLQSTPEPVVEANSIGMQAPAQMHQFVGKLQQQSQPQQTLAPASGELTR